MRHYAGKPEKRPPAGRPRRKKWPLVVLPCLIVAAVVTGIVVVRSGSRSAPVTAGSGLDTPIGKLDLPEEWADEVYVKEASSDGVYTVKASAKVEKEEVLLFTLTIGEKGEGYSLGAAPDAQGTRHGVFLDISAIEGAWSQEENARITNLQSGVNHLIEQINGIEGFEPPSA